MLFRQFIIEWKLFSRDRAAMFWTFAFPVLMLLGFGTIFRSGSTPTLTLVVSGQAAERSAGVLKALERTPVKPLLLSDAEAQARWRKGDTAAQLEEGPAGPRLKVNTYLVSQGQVTAQIVQQANLALQVVRSGQEPQFLPVAMESPGNAHAANYAAFLLPGLLGVNLMSTGLFSVGMVNVSYREKGKFRRLAVTPLPKWVFLAGQVLHRLTVVLLQVLVMLAVGRLVFGIANQGSYALLGLLLVLGTACFMSMGFALAGFARTSEGYGALSNVVFLPMMFLSGVYFTLDAAPRWMQQAVVALPLSPYLKALRAVFNDGAGLAGHGLELALVGVWTALCFGVALRKFSWA
ncbi:ABC transporter permease [Mesoterricola sediminis]|uniref:Transport permease protein n=1 Tax=Mesoterricola sediminis TaxID=2927980 RepID=A0AA48GZ90_9BACT|nr:ABC transporter permease [Mesoterricola sediminis]BDU76772.1 transport permease protein [Mesoterricola sediminis]